jgi:hypothetical protein
VTIITNETNGEDFQTKKLKISPEKKIATRTLHANGTNGPKRTNKTNKRN